MTKKLSRLIAIIMLLAAVAFLGFALSNPQAGFPWSNTITYTIYGIYVIVMLVLFIAPFRKR